MKGSPIDRRIAVARYNPFRRPDWRWQLAQEFAAARRLRHCSDPAIAGACHYIGNQGTKAALSYPDIRQAHEIYSADGMLRAEIEARLLARQSVAAVAHLAHQTENVILTYAALFFDLQDMAEAYDWLVWQAAGVSRWGREHQEGDIWRYMAIVGGSWILDILIGDFRGLPAPVYPERHTLAQQARLITKEFVNYWQSGVLSKALIRQADQLFGHLFAGPQNPKQQMLRVQYDFLRIAAGVPALKPPKAPKKPMRRQDSEYLIKGVSV